MKITQEFLKAQAIANQWYTPEDATESEKVEFLRQEGTVYFFDHLRGQCWVDVSDGSFGDSE